MKRRLAAALLVMLVAPGCRMCSDCCDYSPPLADSPYANGYGRAGSAFSGVVLSTTAPVLTDIADPAVAPTPPEVTPLLNQPPGELVP